MAWYTTEDARRDVMKYGRKNDIVERLRNLVIMDEVGSNNTLAKDAADIIEALRSALQQIVEVPPDTVTTSYDMRRIAAKALSLNVELKGGR